MTREYDKLVRDRIPEVVEEDGERPVVHTVEGEAYHGRLVEKLDEEVAEYRESHDPDELADVLEVVHAIRAYHGLCAEDIEERRERKARRRGRFEEGIVLERVEE